MGLLIVESIRSCQRDSGKEETRMKKLLSATFMAVILVLVTIGLAAWAVTDTATQTFNVDVNSIAVIDVTAPPVDLAITAPLTGGADPVSASDSTTYAQYTSTVSSKTRKITAEISAGSLPGGTTLNLEATGIPGANEGTYVGGGVDLIGVKDIITGIGSCATGTLDTDGAQLTYTLSITDGIVTDLVADEGNPITVTLTLTAEP